MGFHHLLLLALISGTQLQTRHDWELRAAAIKRSILSGARLDPLPARTQLNAIVAHTRFRDGYSVSNVAFEASPGFFVYGNLYRPADISGKAPAVLVPHGHFSSLTWYARTRPENQLLCARLAQMGAVVFTWDMVGWGDSQQVNHHVRNVLQLQLWDSIRAVDFVSQLPFVDPTRIGVTGASGGATQAIYLAAVDDRIQASMPVVMVSSTYTGHERCEDGMPVHRVPGSRRATNVEIAASVAPRPLMVISDGADWTRHFPRDDYPVIERIYSLYGAEAKAGNVHFASGKHDYGPEKCEVAYRFFAQVFALRDPQTRPLTVELQSDQAVRPWISRPEMAQSFAYVDASGNHREERLLSFDVCSVFGLIPLSSHVCSPR